MCDFILFQSHSFLDIYCLWQVNLLLSAPTRSFAYSNLPNNALDFPWKQVSILFSVACLLQLSLCYTGWVSHIALWHLVFYCGCAWMNLSHPNVCKICLLKLVYNYAGFGVISRWAAKQYKSIFQLHFTLKPVYAAPHEVSPVLPSL